MATSSSGAKTKPENQNLSRSKSLGRKPKTDDVNGEGSDRKTTTEKKPLPNYLKPTISSRSEPVKFLKKNNGVEDNQKLLRRRSFDRPPSSLISPSTSSSPLTRKSLDISPARPRDRPVVPREKPAAGLRSTSFHGSRGGQRGGSSVKSPTVTSKGSPGGKKSVLSGTSSSKSKKEGSKNVSKKALDDKEITASETSSQAPAPEDEEEIVKVETDVEVSDDKEEPKEELKEEPKEEEKEVQAEAEKEAHAEAEKEEQAEAEKEVQAEAAQLDESSAKESGSVVASPVVEDRNVTKDEELSNDNKEEQQMEETKGPENNQEKNQESNQEENQEKNQEKNQESNQENEEEVKKVDDETSETAATDVKESANVEESKEEKEAEVKEEEKVSESSNAKEESTKAKAVTVELPEGAKKEVVQGKKESPSAYNDVIASKMQQNSKKNKVLALAGAFQTVIDYETAASK